MKKKVFGSGVRRDRVAAAEHDAQEKGEHRHFVEGVRFGRGRLEEIDPEEFHRVTDPVKGDIYLPAIKGLKSAKPKK